MKAKSGLKKRSDEVIEELSTEMKGAALETMLLEDHRIGLRVGRCLRMFSAVQIRDERLRMESKSPSWAACSLRKTGPV